MLCLLALLPFALGQIQCCLDQTCCDAISSRTICIGLCPPIPDDGPPLVGLPDDDVFWGARSVDDDVFWGARSVDDDDFMMARSVDDDDFMLARSVDDDDFRMARSVDGFMEKEARILHWCWPDLWMTTTSGWPDLWMGLWRRRLASCIGSGR